MWVNDQQILKAVRTGLARLGKDLAGTDSAHLLGAIDIAVAELAARAEGRIDSLRNSWIEAKRLALRGTALAAKVGIDEFSARANALPDASHSGLAALDASYSVAKQLLVDNILSLNAAIQSGAGDDAWRNEVKAFFLDIARHDKQRATENCAAPAVQQDGGDDGHKSGGGIDTGRLKTYLAAWKGTTQIPGPIELIDTKLLSGGFSRQTVLLKVRDSSGRELPLVLRKQVPDGFLDGACNTLFEEKPFFELCHPSGLEIPELFLHETDATVLDGEFFITECMPGSTIGSSYQMAEGIGEPFFKQLAQMLAKLHNIDWSSRAAELNASSRIPKGVATTAEQAALAMVGQFESYWRAAELEPLPTSELMVAWLKQNVPPTTRKVALCHGDIGFHNMLVKDGRITALLDWETSRLADPARDLSYVRPMVTHYVGWDDFMSWYRAAGGPEIDQASLEYYGVFCAFAHVIVTEVAMGSSFPKSKNPDLGYLRLGLPIKAYFFNELVNDGFPIWGGKT